MNRLLRTSIFGLVTLVGLSGCVSTQNKNVVQDDPYYAPVVSEDQSEQIMPTGSLFNAEFANDLYSDRKALRTGDIITVVLRETTQASKAANNQTKRDTSASIDPVIGLGGNAVNLGGESIQLGVTAGNSFKGDAQANQSNSLFGNISVNVVRVLPNGNLVVRGEKWLTLNTGEEFVRLEGLVRPKDIAADNTVQSNRIANARIQYSGKGQNQEAQAPGWLARFFLSTLMPF
ncbi:flagellar basal body L-ring protein FlgH [Pseudoalteromonas xiamenensis]|uniref:flagellar basal body L-ring protein FlgH n=1 Tax=Pseudoalteromonas xiamenensis TaxID=882626 RepID=UPI0027E43DFD|nr:flagellar basal body L-ring protein FlgH [Pseudoalteromonas xiamenensis]WMN59367.1 flagellar basal body L-ring protein FlgH [Pseudoalteromonas xiamenensis]